MHIPGLSKEVVVNKGKIVKRQLSEASDGVSRLVLLLRVSPKLGASMGGTPTTST